MYERAMASILRAEASKMPVVTVVGPRQSGKTTLVRQVFPDHEYVSLERPDERARAKTDPLGFLERFSGTAVMRARREGLARNACVALGNTGGENAVEALEIAMRDPSALVREHAAWALGQIGGASALAVLRRCEPDEISAEVLESIREALGKDDRPPQ